MKLDLVRHAVVAAAAVAADVTEADAEVTEPMWVADTNRHRLMHRAFDG